MKQKQFVAEHHELWSQIQGMLNRRDPEGTEETWPAASEAADDQDAVGYS